MNDGKPKKIKIRDAKPRDVGLFNKLWKAYLESNEKLGAAITTSDRNLAMPQFLFEQYVSRKLSGIVLFVADYAVLMAGEGASPIDYNCGKVAIIWGVHVQDGKDDGVGAEIVQTALRMLKQQGFDSILTTYAAQNEALPKLLPNAKSMYVTALVPLE